MTRETAYQILEIDSQISELNHYKNYEYTIPSVCEIIENKITELKKLKIDLYDTDSRTEQYPENSTEEIPCASTISYRLQPGKFTFKL